MKKGKLACILFLLTFVLTACGGKTVTEATTEEIYLENQAAEAEGVMNHEEILSLEEGAPLVIDGVVKECGSWQDYQGEIAVETAENKVYLCNISCSETEYENMKSGTKIRVFGYKSGEEEIVIQNGTWEMTD